MMYISRQSLLYVTLDYHKDTNMINKVLLLFDV